MDTAGPSLAPFASIPFDGPRARTSRDILWDVKQGLDFIAHNLPRWHSLLVRLNPYPRPWRAVEVVGHEGVRLAAWYGAGKPGGPAILMAPGTFQTKDDTPRKRRAIDLWRRLGAHVLIVDLRGFGGSHAIPGTFGYHEARDLHHAADLLKERSGARRVHLWGESLGGAVSLLAAGLPGAEERFEQVVAWSPFADLSTASTVASPDTPVGRSMLGRMYRYLMRVRTHNAVRTFEEYLDFCAGGLQIPVADLVRRCSPLHQVGQLRVPSVVFHAENDVVVSVEHARMLHACDAPRLKVQIVPRGGHLDFDRAAPHWYSSVTRSLFLP